MAIREVLETAQALANRMRLFQKLALQAEETGTRIDLHPKELWEAADQAILERFDLAMKQQNGERPLFPEEIGA